MEYTALGATGLTVSRIALGCGGFGGIGSAPRFFGAGESEEEARALMDAAWDMGITLFDTADAYGGGRSEAAIGRWVRDRGSDVRSRIVLTTKVFHSVAGDPTDRGLAPARVRRQIEGSLTRLGIDRVDLYLIHEPDPDTPVGETLTALDWIVRSGKVRAIGACNVDGAFLTRARAASVALDVPGFASVQNSYSLLDRTVEEEVLPHCERERLGFTPFSPLAGGWLAGRYRRGTPPPVGSRMATRPEAGRRYENDRTFDALDRFEAAARARGVTMAALALAWLLAEPRVSSVIVGPRLPEHLAPARQALDLKLGASDRAELAAMFAVAP
jgi:aryl-alcohol dehydrogenase-like predicted oxidoreductase